MRDVSIFVNVLLSDIANNFDIQQSKTVLLAQYCAGDKTKKNEMDGACSAYGWGERCVQGFGGATWGKDTTGETQA